MMSAHTAPGLSYIWVTQVRRTGQVGWSGYEGASGGCFISEKRTMQVLSETRVQTRFTMEWKKCIRSL